MDLSYNEDKEKRRRLTGEKTIRCCGQGENMEKYGFGVDVRGHQLQTWSVYRQRETDGKMGDSNGYQ